MNVGLIPEQLVFGWPGPSGGRAAQSEKVDTKNSKSHKTQLNMLRISESYMDI